MADKKVRGTWMFFQLREDGTLEILDQDLRLWRSIPREDAQAASDLGGELVLHVTTNAPELLHAIKPL